MDEQIIKTETGIQVVKQLVEEYTIEEIEAKITEQTDIINNYKAQKDQIQLKEDIAQEELDRFNTLKNEFYA